jgi:hypothetical protein
MPSWPKHSEDDLCLALSTEGRNGLQIALPSLMLYGP